LRTARCLAYADSRMKDFLLTLLHLTVMVARLCGAGGVRAVIAENLLLKQQLIVLQRRRRRVPRPTRTDRILCGFGSLFLSLGRIRRVAIALRPSTLLTFHQALVRRKYRRLFSSMLGPKKPGPKGPDATLIQANTVRRELLDQVPFWNARDLERKLTEFQTYYNAERSHGSLAGHTGDVLSGQTAVPADLNHVRWVSHCRDLVQLPVAA
jgi:Integrase core domain